jgi:hypothetical protein
MAPPASSDDHKTRLNIRHVMPVLKYDEMGVEIGP